MKTYSRPQTTGVVGSENYSGMQNRKEPSPKRRVRVRLLSPLPKKSKGRETMEYKIAVYTICKNERQFVDK